MANIRTIVKQDSAPSNILETAGHLVIKNNPTLTCRYLRIFLVMPRNIFFIGLCIFFLTCTNAQKDTSPQSIIFDSDMGPDYDDVGAITLLHAFADSGYINILATVASTKY